MSGTQQQLSGQPAEVESGTESDPVPDLVRSRVLNILGHRCQGCGATGDLQIHHLTPRSEDGPHALDNLTAFCEGCHRDLHKFLDRDVSVCHPAELCDGEIPEDEPAENLLEALLYGELRVGLADSDCEILPVLHRKGPCTMQEIADEVSVSHTSVTKRLNRLAAANLIMRSREGREWDIAARVEEPMRGHLPSDEEEATMLARDKAAARMMDSGEYNCADIAEEFGVSRRWARVMIDRGRAFDPPIDVFEVLGLSPSDL